MEFVDLGLECWTTVPITLSIPSAVLAGVDKSYGVIVPGGLKSGKLGWLFLISVNIVER